MRRLLIAGNWKMHGSLSMTSELIGGIARGLQSDASNTGFDVLVCPSTAYIAAAGNEVGDAKIILGAQNVNAHSEGAFTGETSLPMLADLDCEYVLLGHSERRESFGDSNTVVAQKFAACVAHNESSSQSVTPVLCIGETLTERQSGDTEQVLAAQIDAVLAVTGVAGFSNAVIAYEPVWAIGTGETASPEQAQAVHRFIRTKLAAMDSGIASALRIIYGGSMKPANAKELLSEPDIDGGLIGGASLQAESFVAICQAASEIHNS